MDKKYTPVHLRHCKYVSIDECNNIFCFPICDVRTIKSNRVGRSSGTRNTNEH